MDSPFPIPPTSCLPSTTTFTITSTSSTIYHPVAGEDQKAKVKEAWTEAANLADAHAKWKPPGWFSSGAYQPAQAMYLGDESKNDDRWLGTGPLKKNIDRQQAIHHNAPLFTYGYFYCDEDKLPTKKKPSKPVCDTKGAAYTFDDLGILWSAHDLVFCPFFFGDRMASLAQRVQEGKDKPKLQGIMEPWRAARARSLFHETYHWGKTVSRPKCTRVPEVYHPKDVVDLAMDENTNGARLNAESWTQAAMAMYVQQTFNIASPPVPKAYAPADVQSDPSILGIDDGDLEEGFLNQMPDWFAPPVVQGAPNFQPNMADVVQLSSIEGVDGFSMNTTTNNSVVSVKSIIEFKPRF